MPHSSLSSWPIVLPAALSLAVSSKAQVSPGKYLATVTATLTSRQGEMYIIDPAARKATKLTLPTALVSDTVNTVTLIGPVLAFVGTLGKYSPPYGGGTIYRCVIAGNKVTATKINTTATAGPNISQMALVGSTLYFVSQDSSNKNGVLQSVPAAGGAVTKLLDLSTLTGWPAGNLANALASDGKTVWVASWGVGASIIAYDIAKKKASILAALPRSKYRNTYFYPVNMHHLVLGGKGTLAVAGLYGDLAYLDPATGKVTGHWFFGPGHKGIAYNYTNSAAYNPDTGDWGIGTRDGALDIGLLIGTGQASQRAVDGVGSSPAQTRNSVNGLAYSPSRGGTYQPFGAGCTGSGNYIPTSTGLGNLAKGSTKFAFGLGSALGGKPAIFFLGTAKMNLDLSPIGAPGCRLYQNLALAIPLVLSGTGNGEGHATLPLPIPAKTFTIYTQWAVLDPVRKFPLVFSDGRMMKL